MLNQLDFQNWHKSLSLTKETVEYIEKIRQSPPSRNVRSGSHNVSGKYSSKKMGMTIQFESHTVELPAIYLMEHEEDILEYYDQPISLKLNYTKTNGWKTGFFYTPDFLVITRDNVYFEEWKTEEQLLKLAKKDSNRYFKDEKGFWRCPPAEKAVSKYGLQFRVRSSNEININLYRNLLFLEDYLRADNYEVLQQNALEIQSIISSNLGISLEELTQTLRLATIDDVYALIVKEEIYVDLKNFILSQARDVPVYSHKGQSDAMRALNINTNNVTKRVVLEVKLFATFLWDSVVWKIINLGIDSIALQSDTNEVLELPKIYFLELLNKGRIKPINESSENKDRWKHYIDNASPQDLEIASKRLEFVHRKLKGQNVPSAKVPNRTLNRWVKNYKDAKELFGNGYIGLLPNTKERGNRKSKLPKEVKEVMDEVIKEEYYTLKQKNKFAVYTKLVQKCEKNNLIIPSYQSLCGAIDSKDKFNETLKRKGHKASYQDEQLYWYLDKSVPRHGDRPFEIAHIDHTELDIELVCSKTGTNLGRPWLTLLIDAYSRMICSFYITFDSPSYRSLMVTMRECVRKHNRLPQTIVVDGGKEFHSIYFDTLLANFELNKKIRPPAKARFGSIIERFFGTTNSSFLHYLQGNTQVTKNVRQITKKNNPKSHAIWTLESLNDALENWLTEIYSKNIHPSLDNQTPLETFEKGLRDSGERSFKLIPYNQDFLVLTMPSIKKGNVKVNSRTGIRINYTNYWNPIFKSILLDGNSVPVRYDPFDISTAYAYVNKQWVTCKSEYYREFKGKTEKELRIATEEIRKRKSNSGKSYTANARRIAEFFHSMESKEQNLTLKLKSQSTQNILKVSDNIDSNTKDLLEDYRVSNANSNIVDIPLKSFNVYQKEVD
ncbi:TnsA endonuclease N-terminal domain-containing protein [Priestia flexa]|uniref:TnsA endonuclease N-terminal domain-containing protein n=1 Tax=Priestia flexa TaxID=86664 RepID=UPI001EF5D690|nr:TnsA endonuclease N-terminal domain-containing protein [Priestia flexa]MCG7313422.1 TnsA endonuclease N-terminal domain-containing protein [Priestia flexa]